MTPANVHIIIWYTYNIITKFFTLELATLLQSSSSYTTVHSIFWKCITWLTMQQCTEHTSWSQNILIHLYTFNLTPSLGTRSLRQSNPCSAASKVLIASPSISFSIVLPAKTPAAVDRTKLNKQSNFHKHIPLKLSITSEGIF